jgi:outer membrane protein assembly factor BamB
MKWLAALAAAVFLLGGCNTAEKPKPTPLQAFEPKIAGRQAWSARVDSVRFPLVISARDGRFFVAGTDGTVLALDAANGSEVWRASAGAPITAGVGSDGRFTSVVTRNNEVVTFDNGREVWRKRVPSRVVTAPLAAGERIFVIGVDRIVHAFDAIDGRRLWTLQRPGDALTLSQGGVITAYRNTLLVGQGARLTAVDPVQGTVVWEVALAAPRGTNEVERLADLIGPVVRVGSRVCARAFQSAVGCADASRGTLLWSRNVGGIEAAGGDADRIFGADGGGRISAWNATSGELVWTSEKLLHRGLSGALGVGTSVLFGDEEGYLHFLAATTGELQLRLPTDGSRVVGVPVLSGTTILVATERGGLFAFRPN